MRKLKVAIIGQGRSGRDIHGKFFLSELNEKFTVVAVVDALPERRKKAAEEYGCPVYADYTELFGRTDIDLVVNSSYSHLHAAISKDLLEHGFHVLCEKPFAADYSDAASVVECAKKTGKTLAVFQQSRFAPYYSKLREIVSSGKLGKIIQYSVRYSSFARRWDWQTAQCCAGGSVRNSGPHPLDQVLELLDFPEDIGVFARLDRVNTFGDAEDYGKIILTAPGKPLVDLEISSCNSFDKFVFNVSGQNGCLRCTHKKMDVRYFDPAYAPEQHFTFAPICDENGNPSHCKEVLGWQEEHIDIEGSVFDIAVKLYYDMLYDHLSIGTPMRVTPEQVLLQMKVIDEIHRQNPLDRKVTL